MPINALSYRVTGEGHPLIFLHGFLENSSMWDEIILHFPLFKVITIDLFGHGNSSDYIDETLTIEHQAEAVLSILKKENIKTYSVVGHSLGGYVALAMLQLGATLNCKHLILLNSHPWADSKSKQEERTQVARVVQKNKTLFLKTAIPNLFRDAKLFPRQVNSLIEDAEKMSTYSIAQHTLAMRDRSDKLDVMEQYHDLIYVIQGKYDQLIPFEKMRAYCDEVGVAYFEINSVGHMAHIEDTSTVIRLITGIIATT